LGPGGSVVPLLLAATADRARVARLGARFLRRVTETFKQVVIAGSGTLGGALMGSSS
jgi:hypothetical protein